MPPRMLAGALVAGLAGVAAGGAGAPPGEALLGAWTLDAARTHYGPGAQPRRWERFTCVAEGRGSLRCTTQGERADGRRVSGGFTVAGGERPSPVVGVPGVDAVRVRTVSATVADATFYSRGVPVLGYRAYRAPEGRALIVVSVDPRTRTPLTSVVVYTRR